MAKRLERLGETEAAPGFLLLGLLSQNGWWVGVTAGFGGNGVLVFAEHPAWGRVEKQGASVAAIATDLVEDCVALSTCGPLQ